jgi:hypothetical protein
MTDQAKQPPVPGLTVSITSPSSGDLFDGHVTGMYSPAEGSKVTVSFWQHGPSNGDARPDLIGPAILDPDTLGWSMLLNVNGFSTSRGFLQAVNESQGNRTLPAAVEDLRVS